MRIAMVVRELGWGIGVHAFQLTKALKELGIETDLFIGHGNNLETNLIPLRIPNTYDVIHIQGSPFGAFKNAQTPGVITVHTTLIKEWEFEKRLNYVFGRFFEVRTLVRSDKIIIVNEILRYELEKFYNVPSDKIVCIPNAINTSEFGELAEGDRGSFIMGCGRNVRRKDFPTLIRACKKLKFPLRLFHGEVSRKELINAYKNASIFVCSSLYETGPLAVMEAMACKCPVVCSNIPAIKDLVMDGKTGLLFKAGDVDDLIWNIQFLMRCPEQKQKMVDNAYNHVKNNFNWENVVKQTVQVYEELI